ncbi:hypothetical protein FQN54_000904 [Arachnomyces sp. PD_36]|nr:hypothetical protein FQN54_000904 [Arachnomyces sp. PD_36]
MASNDPHEPYSTLQPAVLHELDTHKETPLAAHSPAEKEATVQQSHLYAEKEATVHQGHHYADKEATVHKGHLDAGKEATIHHSQPHTEKEAVPVPAGTICGLRRLYFWLLVGLCCVCVIVGAVVGGVVGSRSGNSSDSSSHNGESPQQTTTAGSNSTRSSSLAAVYYDDEAGATEYRLYVQKEDDWIHEYTRTNSGNWTHTSRLGQAAADSPIAATVVYGEVDLDLRVYFPSDEYVVQEFSTQSTGQSETQWTTNPTANSLSKMDTRVLESSSLAALWLFQNETNYHTWVLYQAAESNLTLRGGDGWAIEDVPFRRPSPRTPLAMAQSWTRFNDLSSLTMFYQQEGGDIIGVWGDDKYGWTDLTVPVPAFSSDEDTRLAAFVYDPGSDLPQYMVLLVSNDSGVTSYVIWEGQSTWIADSPPAMSSLDRNTPLAVTKNGRAYGISKGVVKEFRFLTDVSWESVGDVIEL